MARTQLRWVFWAAAVAVGILILGWAAQAALGGSTTAGLPGWIAFALQYATGFGYSLIPLAILFAVLRYGLYSIDRIISRTAAYAIVTLVVIGTYTLVVLLISLLIPGRQGAGPHAQTPPIVIALATLAAAAVFLPVLRLMRRTIDRVFDRSRYDAERIVDDYGERIRNGADPHTAGADLIGAVGQTLQPSAIGLWTRETTQ